MKTMNGELTKRTVAPECLQNHIGEQVRIHGSIYKIRKMRGFAFVLLRTARQVVQCIYSEEKADFSLEELVEESCVIFTAEVVEEERSRTGYELHLLEVEILSAPYEASPIVINNKLVDTSLENLLNFRPVTLRNEKERAIFKIQRALPSGSGGFCRRRALRKSTVRRLYIPVQRVEPIFSESGTSAGKLIWRKARSFTSR